MKKTIFSLLIIAVAMMSSASAFAAEHPTYLKALADLRAARWLLNQHTGADANQSKAEAAAVSEIDAAIDEIKKAAIDDHMNINDHTGVESIPDRTGRLKKAYELLRNTRAEIMQKEDEKFAQGLRARAYQHIDNAMTATQKAAAQK